MGDNTILTLTSHNIEGLNGNLTYAQKMANESSILAIQEHWMHGFEEVQIRENFPNHIMTLKYTDQEKDQYNIDTPRRKGGIALLWKKEIDKNIEVLPEGNARLQALQLKTDKDGSSMISDGNRLKN